MKKMFLFLGIGLTLAVVFSLNFNGLSNSKDYFDLESVIEINAAQAESGGDRRCDYQGGLGIPFWDRLCSDCKIHFNNWYNHSSGC